MSKKPETMDVTEVAEVVPASTLFDRVGEFLDHMEWRYTSSENRDAYFFTIRLRAGSVRVMADVYEAPEWQRIAVLTTFHIFVPEHRRNAIAEALIRINYTLTMGGFDMDMRDGEVRVRTVLETDGVLGDALIDRAVRRGLDLADQYQAPLLAIAFGNASPADVIEMASHSGDAVLQ